MAIPLSAAKVLDDLGIEYQIGAPADSSSAACSSTSQPDQPPSMRIQRALLLLLRSDSDTLQVLCSDKALLDLDALSAGSNVPYLAASAMFVSDLLQAKGFDVLPSIPQLNTFSTLVDRNLLDAEQVYLRSGFGSQVVILDAPGFAKLVQHLDVTDCATPLHDIRPRLNDASDDREELDAAVRNYTSHRIRKTLTETLEIPPLSDTTRRIIALSANPDADASELVEIVEVDPSLTAQVIGWAASPYYSAPGTIKSIHDAIVRVLGFDLVMNLALGLSLGSALKVPAQYSDGVAPYWRQSVYCALTMEKLNQCLPAAKRGIPGMAYLTGLLNNFGYPILAHVFDSHFATVCRYQAVNRHVSHMHIEHFLLGVTRDQMCGQLMAAWNLPASVSNALRFQQSPDYQGEGAVYANLCFVARRLLAAEGIDSLAPEPVPAEVYERLELDPADAELIISGMLAISDDVNRIVSMFPD